MLFYSTTVAQKPSGSGNGSNSRQMNVGHFYGKLIDEETGKPVEGASVQILKSKWDSVTKIKKDHIVSLIVSNRKGEFSFENLSIMGRYTLKVTALGYKIAEKKLSFETNFPASKNAESGMMPDVFDKDLGNIKMLIDAQQLQNVTFNASRNLVELNLDKKIYNVEKDISSIGGSAIDVIKNVPSVTVDIDGNVTLRNAAPLLFVDGRPTTLTPDQIPADQIASIEIMTNPSARYDASGGGAGILNIVLKKNRKAGYNGNVRAGIDSRARPGFGGNINLKQNKVNLFASGMANFRKSINFVKTDRTDYPGSFTAHLLQNNTPVNKGVFAYGRLGLDYFLSNRTTLSVSGNLMRGHFRTRDDMDIFRDTVKTTRTLSESGKRDITAVNDYKNYGGTISFKHNFAKAGKELTADINYNCSNNFNTSDYSSRYYDMNGLPGPDLPAERSSGGGTTNFMTVQSDLINPFKSNQKIEAGIRMAYRNYDSNNDNFLQNQAGDYVYIPALNVKYKYNDVVYAAYTTYSRQVKNFSFQLGLRAESSEYNGELLTKMQQFSNKYPVSLFPSLFITQKLNKKEDLQLNYSRKVNRPSFFQLIPFIDFSDSLNLIVGNPNLVPEFTNLLEFSYQNQFNQANTVLVNLYGRLTSNLITRFQYKDANPDPSKADSILFTSYANANKSYNYGIELTGKNKLTGWWDITTNLNFFNVIIKAENLTGAESIEQFSWFVKLNNNIKLPANFSIQFTGEYQAKSVVPVNSGGRGGYGGGGGGMFGGGSQPTAQGYIKPVYGADFSIRKDFLKNNAASVTLQVSDIFRTRVYDTYAETNFFIQENSRRRDPQIVRLNFNWRFGKFDIALFKRKNMKGEADNMPGMQQGGQ